MPSLKIMWATNELFFKFRSVSWRDQKALWEKEKILVTRLAFSPITTVVPKAISLWALTHEVVWCRINTNSVELFCIPDWSF